MIVQHLTAIDFKEFGFAPDVMDHAIVTKLVPMGKSMAIVCDGVRVANVKLVPMEVSVRQNDGTVTSHLQTREDFYDNLCELIEADTYIVFVKEVYRRRCEFFIGVECDP